MKIWRTRNQLLVTFALLMPAVGLRGDWPMLHGNAQHTGFVHAEVKPPFHLDWAREFLNERIGTAVEPIVGADKVFISTHAGSLYALRVDDGEPLWRFEAQGPFPHSPAFAEPFVIAASVDGNLYAL